MAIESSADAKGAEQGGIAGREYKKLGYSLYVWIADSKLECRCSYVPSQQGSMMTLEELRGYLDDARVKAGIDQDALGDFAIKAAAGQVLTSVLLASGVAPVKGEDGWLSYLTEPSVLDTDEDDDSDDVDLHNVQTFINVSAGDEIARIIPPKPGTPGLGVTGEVLQPEPGKPLVLTIGPNIRTKEDDDSLLIAENSGRVCLASGEISVVQEYTVKGDVNFRVGSIVFNGFVEVRGDVLDGFNITAVRGLRVNGNIGACAIRSEGDISFCGMDGQEKGTIVCGGSITANFIHDSEVECTGDVKVEVELHNCKVKTLGRILVNKGAIAGGSYTALGGIETRKVGSPASVKTTLKAGLDYREMDEVERLLAEIEKNAAQTKAASSTQELEELRKAGASLSEGLMEIRNRANTAANPKINVKTMLYDNTFLRISMQPKLKLDEREGPFSVIENTIEGGPRFLAMTSLDIKASDIEKAFIREQSLKRS